MEKLKTTLKVIRNVVLMNILILSFGNSVFAHRIETFTTSGCTSGQNVVVQAVVVSAAANTFYNWQYRDASGVWKCFTASNLINGVTFTASGFSKSNGPADLGPVLTINAATTALENVQVRLIMADGGTPCGTPAYNVWGGDDEALNETKYLRLHIYTAIGDCGGTTPGCIGNMLSNAQGYYGGFENKSYSASDDNYTDNNFISGAGSSAFTVGTTAGHYQTINNPYAMNTGFTRNIAPHSGNFQMVVMGNTTAAAKVWFKSVTVAAGATYSFSAWVAKVDGTDPNIALRINGTEINNFNLSSTTTGNWVQISANYTASATGTVEISIGDKNAASGANNYTVDDICFRLLGSIGDIVFNDANKNGVKDNGEVGVAGVTVSLRDANGKIIATTVTDAFGNYKFNGLATSATGVTYTIDFGLPAGYQFTAQGGTLTIDNNSDANISTGVTGVITLTNTTPSVTYADAGIYYTTESKIGDRVWNDIDKDGIQDSNEPGIAGVTVAVYTSTGTFVAATITDNKGNYAFYDLPANTYYLRVTPPQGFSVSPKSVLTGGGTVANNSDFGTTGSYQTDNISVVASTFNIDIDAGLYQAAVRAALGDRVWNDLNSDGLQSSGEPGVAGVTVQLYNKTTNTLVATTTTDIFGYYAFNNLASATYYIKFTLPAGFAFTSANTGSDDNTDSDADGTNGTGTTVNIILANDQILAIYDAGIRSTNAALTNLGDFVWYDLNKDGLQTAGEPGVPGVTVMLYSSSNVLLQTTTTDKTGLYKFTGLTLNAQYSVGFSNLPIGYNFGSANAGANDNIDSDVEPTTGRTGLAVATAVSSPNISVDAGIIQAPNVFKSKGTIGDYVWNDVDGDGIQDAGEPGIAGVTVTLYDAAGNVYTTTTTDGLGKYLFTNLPGGTYSVGFGTLPEGYIFTTQNSGTDRTKDSDPNTGTGRTASFTLAAGEINTTIDAGLKNSVTGLFSLGNLVWNDLNGNGVYDAATEQGLSGISVTLYDVNMNPIATAATDEGGFYLFTGLASGTYILGFSNLPAGYTATTRNVASPASPVDNDSDPNIVSFMSNPITLTATDLKWDFGIRSTTVGSVGDRVWNDLDLDGVQDAGEPGVSGILVTLYNGTTAIASTVTDGTGYYYFKNVPAGSYSVGFSTLPGNTGFTVKNTALNGGTAATDSDVDPVAASSTYGKTGVFALAGGQNKTDIDAGLISLFASVGDYVWNDANTNGLQDANEKPIAGMTITLYDAANQPVTSAISDGKGFYFINNIPVASGGTSFYLVFSGLVPNSIMTTKNAGSTTLNSPNNNDFSTVSGVIRTDAFTLVPGQNNPNIDAGVVLPPTTVVAISGLQLTASLGNNNVTDLKWSTEAEINNDHFEIERSVDGINFKKISDKAAVGFTITKTDYNTVDVLGSVAKNPVIYYRVKSMDINGNFTFSNIVSVRPAKSASVEVWPNPFAAQINIKVTAAERSQVSVIITDSKGTTVKKSDITLTAGANFISYTDIANLAKGAYTIRIIKGNETVLSQVIVKN